MKTRRCRRIFRARCLPIVYFCIVRVAATVQLDGVRTCRDVSACWKCVIYPVVAVMILRFSVVVVYENKEEKTYTPAPQTDGLVLGLAAATNTREPDRVTFGKLVRARHSSCCCCCCSWLLL